MKRENNSFSYAHYLHSCIKFYHTKAQQIIALLIKSWKLPSFVALILIAFCSFKYYSLPTQQQFKITYVYNCLHKKVFGDWILELNKLLEHKQYKLLSQKLNLPLSLVKNIKSLNATNIAGSPLNEDITEAKLPFYVNVDFDVSDKNLSAALLRQSITDYMNEQPRAKLAMSNIVKKREQQISYIEKQLSLLDAGKVVGASNEKSELYPTKEIYELSDKYFHELNNLNTERSATTAVEVFDTTTPIVIGPKTWLIKKGIPLAISVLLLSIFFNALVYWYKNTDF